MARGTLASHRLLAPDSHRASCVERAVDVVVVNGKTRVAGVVGAHATWLEPTRGSVIRVRPCCAEHARCIFLHDVPFCCRLVLNGGGGRVWWNAHNERLEPSASNSYPDPGSLIPWRTQNENLLRRRVQLEYAHEP